MQGILVINKERGFTSFDVVAKLRGILKTKKIGHTGTLDPEAEGVLVCCIGKATKLVDTFINHEKSYQAKLLLGKNTDTYDIWGEILEERPVSVSEDEIRDVISSFIGRQNQIPPMYSAKKVNGKKLYELARAGETVEREAVPIEIYDIKITDISIPEVSFTVDCSKGTYIRSLCHDIGEKLGCGGCMSGLKRIRTGDFTIEQAYMLFEVEDAFAAGRIEDIMLGIDEVLGYKKAFVTEGGKKLLMNGNRLPAELVKVNEEPAVGEYVCMYHPDGRFAATYIYDGSLFLLDKIFLEQ